MKYVIAVSIGLVVGAIFRPALAEDAGKAPPPKPSVLIINGTEGTPLNFSDLPLLQELHQQGLQVDVHYNGTRPLRWELISKYNCLVFIHLPPDQVESHGVGGPPFRKAMIELMDRYLAAGGGIFIMPDFQGYAATLHWMKDTEAYLERWGARLPLDLIQDPASETVHPRNGVKFIYTTNIAPSPVSDGVKGLWFPGGGESNWAFMEMGNPLEVTTNWTAVVRGANSSFTKPMVEQEASLEHALVSGMFHRADQKTPPTLYAIREVGNGRVALTVLWQILALHGGSSWLHDGVVLNKGLAGKPSDFGKLFGNTLRWLAEPSLKSGQLGGYVQDPLQLVHPHFRKQPDEFFPEFEAFQNPTSPAQVFRGLIGAHTAYSQGQGTVAEYAAAAQRAGLDFVVFLEPFGKISEPDYRKLEADCQKLSSDKLLLIPGLRLSNNIGNNMFVFGKAIPWPKPSQLSGPNKDQLRTQCFDKDGNLTYSDEDAKNWLWINLGQNRNIGYYDFRDKAGMLVRNLRLYGILGVVTYRDGQQVEDITKDYLDNVTDGAPPLACAVDLVDSPAQLEAAVKNHHYLTEVATTSIQTIPEAMWYGHPYGRFNVYLSSGPQIRSWAGTQRFMSFAGESFIAARRHARPECWVTSAEGLKEIIIYSENRPIRRLLFNGEKEFHRTFEWAYDRHREMVLVATDVKGQRAVSAARSQWSDANQNWWCGDRQNGEMWHGPITFPGPQAPYFRTGPSWDGGPVAFIGARYESHPMIVTKSGESEGGGMLMGGRWMEGNVYPTCFDDSVANFACVGENDYAPGVVVNAYATLGPCHPTKYMTFTLRRTQFLQRGIGPMMDGHAMFVERTGGNLAVIEGTITFKQDVELTDAILANIYTMSFPKNSDNYPLWAIHTAAGNVGMGPFETYTGAGLGREQPAPGFLLDTGGYVSLVPSKLGNSGLCFNLGDRPLLAVPSAFANWYLKPAKLGAFKKGDVISWRYLVINDGLDQPARNLMRLEELRRYYGLAGQPTSGLTVKRGKLLSSKGLVDLAPENGVIDFEVPHPGWNVNLPLGVRLIGFNPNWAVCQLQVEGFLPGFSSLRQNACRNLGLDDRDMAFVAVYPDAAPKTHNIIGHPVQCDNSQLVIEVAQLSTQPFAYHVAVNNPTDAPIKTILKKCLELPGFEFPDTPVDVPAGGYIVVKEK